MSDLLHVLNIRSGIDLRSALSAAFAAQFQHARAQAAQEHAIMRNENHGAFKILERFHQHFFRRQIKMVGGLVEHEKVGGL